MLPILIIYLAGVLIAILSITFCLYYCFDGRLDYSDIMFIIFVCPFSWITVICFWIILLFFVIYDKFKYDE